MLFQCIAEYLWPKIVVAARFLASLLLFVILIFGLNIFAAINSIL